MPQPAQSPPATSADAPRRRLHRVPSLALTLALAAASSAWLWPRAGWLADLAANLAPQWAAVAGVALVVCCLRRRWVGGSAAVACAVMGLLGVALQPRAGAAVSEAGVRVLVVNAAASNTRSDEVLSLIRGTRPDVVVVLETPRELLGLLREDGALRAELPFAWLPERAGTGYTAVLTRWAQRGGEDLSGGASQTLAGGLRAMLVDRPGGAFTLLVLHPESARTPARWRAGNALVEHAIGMVRDRLRPAGLPVVMAGDLNSAPAGLRSRRLCSGGGLRRAKPLLRATGTWPAWSFWPLRLAIDDVLVDPGTGVVAWGVVPVPGSDHSAVLVELAIAAP